MLRYANKNVSSGFEEMLSSRHRAIQGSIFFLKVSA